MLLNHVNSATPKTVCCLYGIIHCVCKYQSKIRLDFQVNMLCKNLFINLNLCWKPHVINENSVLLRVSFLTVSVKYNRCSCSSDAKHRAGSSLGPSLATFLFLRSLLLNSNFWLIWSSRSLKEVLNSKSMQKSWDLYWQHGNIIFFMCTNTWASAKILYV